MIIIFCVIILIVSTYFVELFLLIIYRKTIKVWITITVVSFVVKVQRIIRAFVNNFLVTWTDDGVICVVNLVSLPCLCSLKLYTIVSFHHSLLHCDFCGKSFYESILFNYTRVIISLCLASFTTNCSIFSKIPCHWETGKLCKRRFPSSWSAAATFSRPSAEISLVLPDVAWLHSW